MPTPHINAKVGDIAETVLLPGDPLRAKYIAENFLENAVQVNTVRNMFGFTGTFNGHKISVMGTGMGVPSISIYATELVRFYGVKKLIRIGSCGTTMYPEVKLGDVVIAIAAGTDSNHARIKFSQYDMAACADYELLSTAVSAAKEMSISHKVGKVFTSDMFYRSGDEEEFFDLLQKWGYMGIEMETSALYSIAAEYGCQALAICTVTDEIRKGTPSAASGGRHHERSFQGMSSEEREVKLNDMINMALRTCEKLNHAKAD